MGYCCESIFYHVEHAHKSAIIISARNPACNHISLSEMILMLLYRRNTMDCGHNTKAC